METTGHRLARYAITTTILLIIGVLFLRQRIEARRAPSNQELGLGPVDVATADIGQQAPDFVLRTLDGQQARLSEFRGKTVVLNFWASWCTPCRQEMADFEALYRDRQAVHDFVVLAVDYLPLDGEADARRFVSGLGDAPGFPILFDTPDGAVAERYGVAPRHAKQAALPVSFFIDRNGVLRGRVFGPVTDSLAKEVAATEAAAR